LSLRSANVRVESDVSDARLAELLQTARLSVVPLRYGAGIKGKILESMHRGLPVVTTNIGAEGIRDAERCMAISDDAAGFAGAVGDLYHDQQRWEEFTAAGQAILKQYFSTDAVIAALEQDIVFPGLARPTDAPADQVR